MNPYTKKVKRATFRFLPHLLFSIFQSHLYQIYYHWSRRAHECTAYQHLTSRHRMIKYEYNAHHSATGSVVKLPHH